MEAGVTSHQEEASWGEPAGVAYPRFHQLVACGPVRASQGYAAACCRFSTANHLSILGVQIPPSGKRWH